MKQHITTLLLGLLGLAAIAWVSADPLAESMARGKVVYDMNCMVCHLGQGEGVPGVNPPLAGSDYLMEKPIAAARAIKYGQQGKVVVNGVTYNSYMANLGLDDDEVADVMNYIMNSWGNEATEMITEEWVAAIKKE